MHAQRSVRVQGHCGCHPGCGVRVGAVAAEVLGELGLLDRGKLDVHPALERDLGVDQLVLVGHRHVFSGAHRERAGYQRGHAS